MLRTRMTRPLAVAAAATALAVAGGAAPAMALPIDRPAINTNQVDFGNSWANQAPTSGGTLDWDTGNGNTCLSGNIYMKNAAGVTAQVWLEMYTDGSHSTPALATTKSLKKTAVGNALNIFTVNLPCINSAGTHAHVVLKDDHANIGGPLLTYATVTEDE
jgi:hypothetical protein